MQVGGPQEERSRRLMRDPLMDPPAREREFVVPVDFRMQEETYQEKLAVQHEEITFLKSYIEKLLNQLRRVLVKHNELEQLQTLCDPTTACVTDEGEDSSMVPPPWFTSKEYMSPLFAAYEGRIKELDIMCEKHRKDLDAFVVHAQSLALDNDRLQQELTSALEKLILQSEQPAGGRGSTDFFTTSVPDNSMADQLSEMNERLDFLMSENNLLVEQRSLVESELEECQRDIHERDSQLLTMSQNFNQASVAIQELRDACNHLKLEKQKCEVQLQQFAATIAQLEAQKETIASRVTGLQTNATNYVKQIDEYERTLANLKLAAEQKQATVTKRYQGVCERLRELTSALDAKHKQVDEWQERHRGVVAELDLVKQDCEGMVKVMHSMEKQLNEYAAREEAVAELERSTVEKAHCAALERDQAIAKEMQCRREISRLLEQKRIAASDYLKATDDAVERVRRKLDLEIQHRMDEIKHAQASIVTLKMQLETASRMQLDAEKHVKECMVQGDSRQMLFQEKFNQIAERVAVAEQLKADAETAEARATSLLAAKEAQFQKTLADLQDKLAIEHEQLSSVQRELDLRRAELRDSQESNAAKEKQVALLTNEVQDIRNESNQKHKYQLDMYSQQLRDAKSRLDMAENEVMKVKHDATKTEQMLRLDHSRVEAKYKTELEVASHRANRLKDEKSRIEAHLLEVQAKQSMYATKIIHLEQELADAHHQCSQWQMHVDEAERKSSDVASQLKLVLSSQQQHLRAEVELKSMLDRTKLEKARLEREVAVLRKSLDDLRQRPTHSLHTAKDHSHPHLLPVAVDKVGT
ncbi:hypothetical protein, variant 1 [Aphanomyces invadans]|uniref:Uncharacterized protein n=1 Tax=Aphanomyces invadans TaxID=157072 RepID=A0A024UAV5_9STRA|nr:hypothetical protein, variant 1 [Aphanomyces invadans]ETW03017.1 hypothetical protein, variant 1 [Aphanomyces invadans]|eukprot:XP_008868401.1 hypothetical protein, variant 1 [Aphanomyces invadans]